MHKIGGRMLETLINADGGDYRGRTIPCAKGHGYEFVESREKNLLTVLGLVAVRRAYYLDKECGSGYCPKDRVLDIEGTSYSSGVRRMTSRVGAYRSFGLGLLITTIIRQGVEVLFRPEEACIGTYLTKGFEGLAGLLSRRTDRWMM